MNPADVWLWVAVRWVQTAHAWTAAGSAAVLMVCRAARLCDDHPAPPNPNPPVLASVTVDDADWRGAAPVGRKS